MSAGASAIVAANAALQSSRNGVLCESNLCTAFGYFVMFSLTISLIWIMFGEKIKEFFQ